VQNFFFLVTLHSQKIVKEISTSFQAPFKSAFFKYYSDKKTRQRLLFLPSTVCLFQSIEILTGIQVVILIINCSFKFDKVYKIIAMNGINKENLLNTSVNTRNRLIDIKKKHAGVVIKYLCH